MPNSREQILPFKCGTASLIFSANMHTTGAVWLFMTAPCTSSKWAIFYVWSVKHIKHGTLRRPRHINFSRHKITSGVLSSLCSFALYAVLSGCADSLAAVPRDWWWWSGAHISHLASFYVAATVAAAGDNKVMVWWSLIMLCSNNGHSNGRL